MIVILVSVLTLSGIVFFNIAEVSTGMAANADTAYLRQQGRNLAQSGVNLGVRQLVGNRSWRSGFSNKPMMDGTVSVSLRDSTYDGIPVVAVAATATVMGGSTYAVTTQSTAFIRAGFFPPAVKGVLTTRNPISLEGDYEIDGRNRTKGGALIPVSGVRGIWTTNTFLQGGDTKVGGTAAGADFSPSKPAAPSVIAQNQPLSGSFLGTPDSVFGGAAFGFPEGTLKRIAMSGAGGSQYVTSPAALTYPLRGITYLELPNGGTWTSCWVHGTGLLIVSNQWRNATLRDQVGGLFTGMIVVDDFVKLKGFVHGALVSLTAAPSAGATGGKSHGKLTYSREVLIDVTEMLLDLQMSSDSNVIAWKE